ncbi:MAG: DUF2249 domain-containing protein [Halodesulfurarchaeum sp.]|nr:DUF2249 domain-containing protein [Halodesulfurarchaeum sp.]
MEYDGLLAVERVPEEREQTVIDVRELPPPEPLQETLGTLGETETDGLLVQINDRQPQHLFPMLEERGYEYESTGSDPAYTAIWKS